MNIEAITQMLIDNEGMILHEYKDHLGYSTIGVGRLIEKDKGGLTEEECKYLLENDIGRVMARLDRNFSWWRDLSEGRQHVMIDLSFNLGNRLSKFVKFLSNLEAGLYEAAATELLDSLYAKQVPNRAERNADIIRTG